MIKKLSSLLFLCFMLATHADQLSDAIQESDLQTVTSLLSELTLTDKQLIKYLDSAEQVIKTRRDEIKSELISVSSTISTDGRYRPTPSIYPHSKLTMRWGCATLAFLPSMVVFGVLADDHHSKAIFEPLQTAKDYHNRCEKFSSAGAVGSLIGLLTSFIAFAICDARDCKKYREHRLTLYKNAIRIKELLYDYDSASHEINE